MKGGNKKSIKHLSYDPAILVLFTQEKEKHIFLQRLVHKYL